MAVLRFVRNNTVTSEKLTEQEKTKANFLFFRKHPREYDPSCLLVEYICNHFLNHHILRAQFDVYNFETGQYFIGPTVYISASPIHTNPICMRT